MKVIKPFTLFLSLIVLFGFLFTDLLCAEPMGTFKSQKNAVKLVKSLKAKGQAAYYKRHAATKKGGTAWYVVYRTEKQSSNKAGEEVVPTGRKTDEGTFRWLSVAKEIKRDWQSRGLIQYAQAGGVKATDAPRNEDARPADTVVQPGETKTAPAVAAPTPQGSAVSLPEGIRQYQAENYEEAIEILKKVRTEDPASATAAFFLGMAFKQTNDFIKPCPTSRRRPH
jgi:hypothetical protein